MSPYPSTQADGLSFERDIQPLSKRLFANTFGRMNARNAAASFEEGNARLVDAFAQRSQIKSIEDQQRENQMQYNTAVFSLEHAREKARQERENLTQALPLQDQLIKTLNDPTLDNPTKKRVIGTLGVTYGSNPNAAVLLNAARSGVADEEKKKFTVGRFLESTQGRGAGYLKELQAQLKRPLEEDEEIPYVDAYAWVVKDQKDEAATKYDRSKKDDLEKEEYEGALKALEHGATKIKWAKDLSGTMDSDTLATPADEQILDATIALFASPEERAAAKTPRQKQALVSTMYAKRLSGAANLPMRTPLPSQRTTTRNAMTGTPE